MNMIQQNNEFSNNLNEENKLDTSSITPPTDFSSEKIPAETSFFMKYLRFIYIIILIFYTAVILFAVGISHVEPNSEDPMNTALIYIFFGDIIILQAIFATWPQVIFLKKLRLLLPVIFFILFIYFSS